MIGDKIEKNITKEHKNKTQLIVSIIIVFVVIILFAVFMRLDFSKPEEQREIMSVEEIGKAVDEFSKTISSDQQSTVNAVNKFSTKKSVNEVKNTVDKF